MPLIKDGGVTSHDWRFAEPHDVLTHVSHVVAPFDRLEEVLDGEGGRPIGLALPNTAVLDGLVPHFVAFSLLTVAFPSFADGRGFSLAQRLRARGYEGELWAAGHLIPDQYGHARSCGFDGILVDDDVFARQNEADWLEAASALSLSYQAPSSGWESGPRSILELRRAARMSLAAE